MPHSPFKLLGEYSKELIPFPHVIDIGLEVINSIKLNSLPSLSVKNLQMYLVLDGRFNWLINSKHEVLYPGDTAVILPGQEFGGLYGHQDIGTLVRLQLRVQKIDTDGRIVLGKWSKLSKSERLVIWQILKLNDSPVIKCAELPPLFQEVCMEIKEQELGFVTRVNHILDTLLILICRQVTRQAGSRRDFPQTFTNLEKNLRQNLLKLKETNITDIALKTGFYSSQHFSTTFKKLTGHTPNEFRKRNTTDK